MSQLTAINQELLRQINDPVGYKIKTKVDRIESNVALIATRQGGDTANISLIVSQLGGDTANINYLKEVTAINDTSLASTVGKSLEFHKFLTTEHIPASNLFASVSSLQKTGDTYGTGIGACGVRKTVLTCLRSTTMDSIPDPCSEHYQAGKALWL